jgi:hypothetical protein
MALGVLCEHGYDIKFFSENFQNVKMHFPKMENGISENGKCISISNTNEKTQIEKKEEDTNVSPKKYAPDYQKIVDCWNEYNGKRCGKVTKITDKRKKAIKKIVDEHEITQDELMRLFKTLPFADSWLYNPTKEHKGWKPDFDWWMSNTNGWFTKALEGKVHTQNVSAFSKIMSSNDSQDGVVPYFPTETMELNWNDHYNCYIYMGQTWLSMPENIFDGYSDDDRPNGAKIMLNSGRGTIVWDSATKKWSKQ